MATGIVMVEPSFLGQFNNKEISAYKPALNVDNRYEDIDKITDEDTNKLLEETIGQIQNVGRPVNGILAKPNTHAYVQVIGPQGKPIQCFNNIGLSSDSAHNNFGYYLNDRKSKEPGGQFDALKAAAGKFKDIFNSEKDVARRMIPPKGDSPKANVWTDWILQSVQESRIEKTQVIETFGDSYFYAFGQKPRSIAFSGLLMNTVDHNWRSIFWKNWDEYFRATKLVEKGARVYIQWDDIIVEGYPINAVCSEVADSPNAMKFSFQLFVTRYVNISAQSGFLTQKYMRVAQLKAGSGVGMISGDQGYRLLGGEAFTPKSFNYERNGMFGLEGALGLRTGDGAQYEKFSLLGQMGPQLGNSLKRAALQSEAVRDAQQTETGKALLRQVGYAASAAQKALRLMKRGTDRDMTMFQNSYLRQLGQDMFTSMATDVTNLAEDAMNVRRGEINQMIGSMTTLVDLSKESTKGGKTFKLSPSAKYSSVQRIAASWVSPGNWGGTYTENGVTRGWGERAGGITMLANDGTPISEVIADFSLSERVSVEDFRDW
jgi:hypothetical protein